MAEWAQVAMGIVNGKLLTPVSRAFAYIAEPMMQADVFGPPYLPQCLNFLNSGNRFIGVLPLRFESLVSKRIYCEIHKAGIYRNMMAFGSQTAYACTLIAGSLQNVKHTSMHIALNMGSSMLQLHFLRDFRDGEEVIRFDA